MKTVVITGSARGFGFAMLKFFRENGFNTVLCDINLNALMTAKEELGKIKSDGKIMFFKADISDLDDIDSLIDGTLEEFGTIDIWINNAAINQFNLPAWEIYDDSIIKLVDTDLKSVMLCSFTKEIISSFKSTAFVFIDTSTLCFNAYSIGFLILLKTKNGSPPVTKIRIGLTATIYLTKFI